MRSENWRKIKEIFYPALELPASERADFVREKCGADESLKDEVEKLLAAHEQAENFIESPTVAVKKLVADESPSRNIGRQIGAYRLEKEIGRGGMGAVYLAARADAEYEKYVAVKLIKRGLDTDEIISRFRHERQILATLDHPNIARLIDGGATDDGLPYLVMDYVAGLPLAAYCREKGLSIKERLEIFLQICSAVAYAHRNLIVHRDLKPSNILVTDQNMPKLLDFGIAKLLTPETDFSTLQTATNVGVMTPEYASPEQVRGEQVTTATDVYSLGVVLYELLTDRRPFDLSTKSLEKIMHTICEVEPPRPSSVVSPKSKVQSPKSESATDINEQKPTNDEQRTTNEDKNPKSKIPNPKSLKGDLDNIILMAMRKEPARRYSSVEQFAEDIRRHLTGLPVSARQDSFSYRAEKFIRRHKTVVAAGAGVAMSLVGGIIGVYRQSKIAARERDAALAEAEKAERINRFLQKMLAAPDPRVIGKDVKVLQVLDMAAENIAADFAHQPEITADLQTTIGLTYLSLGLFEKAAPMLENALETRRKIYGKLHRETAMSYFHYGRFLQTKGDLPAAEPLYLESLAILRRFGKAAQTDVAKVLNNLGYLLALKGEPEESLRIHREEFEIRRHYLGEDHPETARSMGRLGSVLTILEDMEKAEILHRRALAVFRKHYGENHPDTALELISLVGAVKESKPLEAQKLALEALKIRRSIFGENHPDVAWARYNLAYLAIQRGDAAEASDWAEQVLRMCDADLPSEHPSVSSSLHVLGRSLLAQNKPDAAKISFEKCLNLRRKTLPPDHYLMATTNSFIAECLILSGHADEGKILLSKSYTALREKLGENHEQTRLARAKFEKLGHSAINT